MLKGGDVRSIKQIESGSDIVIWQWRIDDKDWMSYNDKLCEIMEKLNMNESYTYYKANINKTYIITKITKSTGIEKLQSNGDDTVSWKLRRITQKRKNEMASYGVGVTWQWKTNNNEWIPCNHYICNQIEPMDINQCIKFTDCGGKQNEIIRDSKDTATHIWKFELIESRTECRRIEGNIYLNKNEEIQRLKEELNDKEKIIKEHEKEMTFIIFCSFIIFYGTIAMEEHEKEIVDRDRKIKDKDKTIEQQTMAIEELKKKEDELKELKKEIVVIWQWKKQGNDKWVNYVGDYNEKFEKLGIDEICEYTTTTHNKYKFVKKTRINGELILMNKNKKMKIWQVRRIIKLNGDKTQQKEIDDLKVEIINKDKEIKDLLEDVKNLEKKLKSLRDETKPKQIKNKTKCIVCWEWLDDDNLWKSYPKDISLQIEKLKKSKSIQYTFSNHTYKITKQSKKCGIQNNTKTNKSRNIRRNKKEIAIKGYATPKLHSLSSYKEKTKSLFSRFSETVNGYKIIKIESIHNEMLYDSYYNERKKMIKLIGAKQLNERELFHGTREDVMKIIQIQGFRKEFNSRASYGAGTYFAKNAKYSFNYSQKDNNGIYQMFVCKVLCGEMVKGDSNYSLKKWPIKNNGLIYDSLVDNTSNPSIFVIHEDFRAYPMFIIHFIKNN